MSEVEAELDTQYYSKKASASKLMMLKKYYELKIQAIEAIIPVIRSFDGKKPCEDTFSSAIEASFEGVHVYCSWELGVTINYKANFRHPADLWDPIISHIDEDKRIDACSLIDVLQRRIDYLSNTITDIDATIDHLDEMVNKWNAVVKSILDIKQMIPKDSYIRDAIAMNELHDGTRFNSITKNNLIAEIEY